VKLSVVIPALDEAERIEAAIQSARSARPEPFLEPNSEPSRAPARLSERDEHPDTAPAVEVIVADGGSLDDTAARAARAGARVVRTERGRARQLRDGILASSGDVVLMLHADTRLSPGWARAVCRALDDPGVVGGAFRLRFDERSPGLALVEWGARLRAALWQLPYGDQALFARRAALDAAGGIPQVPVMEDLDLVQALKRRGRLALLPLPALTSARRYREGGTARTWLRHQLALAARALGVDRARLASWVGR
jgi:rSAM/selenodomain-associated transferase 2